MRRHRSRAQECGTKVRHPDRATALGHMRRLQRQRGAAEGSMRAYRCPRCGGWHVGHRERRR